MRRIQLGPDAAKLSKSGPKRHHEAWKFLANGQLEKARRQFRAAVDADPEDWDALKGLGQALLQKGSAPRAQKLLRRYVDNNPDDNRGRSMLANACMQNENYDEALQETEILLGKAPGNPAYQTKKGGILTHKGDFDLAREALEAVLLSHPNFVKAYLARAQLYRTTGKYDEAVADCKNALEIRSQIPEVYALLSNLKKYQFSDDDIESMLLISENERLVPDLRASISFALGQAYELNEDYEKSLEYYTKGNKIKFDQFRSGEETEAELEQRLIASSKSQLLDTRGFFSARVVESLKDKGLQEEGPIFIVGLPRAGSTLIEQILSSHSKVNGGGELKVFGQFIGQISQWGVENELGKYPNVVPHLEQEQLQHIGRRYLEETRKYRDGGVFFTDKMPNNFVSVGLIKLALPNAKIIDARRHPAGACFGNYKQVFQHGYAATYNMQTMANFYQGYMKVMAHWDEVFPGEILRVIYEDVVSDTEVQIRRMLNFVGLDYEPGCSAFYTSKRPVRTFSAEQVRQPIYQDGIDKWKRYLPGIEPMIGQLENEICSYKF